MGIYKSHKPLDEISDESQQTELLSKINLALAKFYLIDFYNIFNEIYLFIFIYLFFLFIQHTQNDVSSPTAYADRLTFEMHKTYQETRLQLIVSPVTVVVNDQLKV